MKKITHHFYTYKVTKTDTGEFYLGKRCCTKKNIEDDTYLGSGLIIKRYVKKYGKSAFTKEIIGVYQSLEELNSAEAKLITDDVLSDPLCLNIARGGYGGQKTFSEQTRKKISEALKGKKKSPEHAAKCRLVNVGRKQSEETRKKRSVSMKGRNPWDYQTDETRRKISEALKGRTLPEDVRKKMSIAKTGKLPNNAKSVCFRGVIYQSMHHASVATGIPYTTLRRLLKKEMKE